MREPTYSLVTTTGVDGVERPASFRIPQGTARLLREQQQKLERIQRDMRTGRVIFRPITLPDGETTQSEVE